MKNGKLRKRSGFTAKTVTMILAVVLVLGCVIGGVIAWLTDRTDPLTNTFTVGDINIDLAETTEDFKMVPGSTIDKDPKVTVKAGSEACWLFVKVEKSANLDSFITYAIADGWTALPGHDGVYYREVPAGDTDAVYSVLSGDRVTVRDSVTKDMMDGLTEGTMPTLTFTAYAVQKDNIDSAADAWAKINP